MYPFRIFLSYSHEDRELVSQVARVLEELGLQPLYDRHIRPGSAFNDAIRGLILHAHIFMPVITDRAQERPWVHQETGYAMALNTPILPLAIGHLPGEMIAQLQAIQVQPDLSDLCRQLDGENLERIVMAPGSRSLPVLVEVADDTEERYRLTAQYASRVADELGYFGRVRQCARISLFNAPDAPETDPIWRAHDGLIPRSPYLHKMARQQRRIMERHARKAGCRLLIDPVTTLPELSPEAQKSRVSVLVSFLESMPDELVQVACLDQAGTKITTMVGDWFCSESPVRQAGQGWRHTIFTWHPPTVLRKVREFDELLEAQLAAKGVKPADSKRVAIQEIRKLVPGMK
jgi:hypothetical protein